MYIYIYMVVRCVCFYLILYIMYSYCYFYVFLFLSIIRYRYCVSLCCSVFCLCVCVLYYCHRVSTQLQLSNICPIISRYLYICVSLLIKTGCNHNNKTIQTCKCTEFQSALPEREQKTPASVSDHKT